MGAPKYTEENAHEYVREQEEDIMAAYKACKEIPAFARGPLMEEVWRSGCWLGTMLRKEGASEEDVQRIGFAHGQRSFAGDPYGWAVKYLNEYVGTRSINDQPGEDLAAEINEEVFGRRRASK